MKKYICIGGPLDGQYLPGVDNNYQPTPGLEDYVDFNAAHGRWSRRGIPSMVRIHISLVAGKLPKTK